MKLNYYFLVYFVLVYKFNQISSGGFNFNIEENENSLRKKY